MDLHKQLNQKHLLIFWKKIQHFKHLTIQFERTLDQRVEKNKGHAQLEIESPNEYELHFKEKGVWDKTQISFTNIWRWILNLDQGLIGLEHLRFGETKAVALVELKVLEKDYLVSNQPHLCGKDQYVAECWIKNKKLHLQWKIMGPKKKDTLLSTYSH